MKTQEQRDKFAAYMRDRAAKIRAGTWVVVKRATKPEKAATHAPVSAESVASNVGQS